jgi:signal transduction histidine kinase
LRPEKLKFALIEVYSFLAGLARDYYPRAQDFYVKVNVEDHIRRIPDVAVHVGTLQHAIGNVLDNAIKYSNRDTEVTVDASTSEDALSIVIEDEGIALRAVDTERIFHYGTRTEEAQNSRAPDGTGVGLWLARKIIKDVHGGEIWAEATDRRGFTRFHIALPLTRPQNSSQ